MFNFTDSILKMDGWLTEVEGTFLYRTAKGVSSSQTIVEIGSWKGKSTVCLGKGVQEGKNAKIFAIDPHIGSSEHQKKFGKVDTYQNFLDNIKNAGVKRSIHPIRETSEEASKTFHQPIGFLFVDGAHEYHMVNLDIKSWFSKVTDGGVIAFHDSWHFVGVNVATAMLLIFSPHIKNPRLFDTITAFEKVKQNSLIDRIYNVLFLLYRTFSGWIGAIKIGLKDNLHIFVSSNYQSST